VRGLQSDLAGEVDVLLINIHDSVGSAVLDRFGFQTTPLYLIFDGAGSEVYRSGAIPDKNTVLALVAES
jgi:hypothetical protein